MYTCEQDDKYVAPKLYWLSDADVADVASHMGFPMHEEHDQTVTPNFMQIFVAKVVDSYIYYRAWALLGVVVGYPKQIAAWFHPLSGP